MRSVRAFFSGFDPFIIIPVVFLCGMGLVTMYSYQGENIFFERQLMWIVLASIMFFLAFLPDYRLVRSGHTLFLLYLGTIGTLILLLFFGEITMGAQRRFDLGFFSLQPSEPAKLILIAILAKYFSKRHELIGDFKHILVSGVYTFGIFALVFVQPDFGSAAILFMIWFGMVLIAGIKAKHLLVVFLCGMVALSAMWFFAFADYQKQRILTFLDPLADIQGSGYNAYQSTVAVGSGQLLGKGIGYGTQSKLQFLPEYETDFIFAAFAEEWGLVGVGVLFVLFGILIWRLLLLASWGATNFERLFIVGVCILLVTHFFIHIGINIGVMPVTGTTMPFLSYGGTHLMTEFIALGMVLAMNRYRRIRTAKAELQILEQ